MKTELSKIAQDLEQGTITDKEARKLLLGLLGVSNRSFASPYTMARWFHEKYEEAAKHTNWNTQDSCKVDFDDLPSENQRTMILVCEQFLNGC